MLVCGTFSSSIPKTFAALRPRLKAVDPNLPPSRVGQHVAIGMAAERSVTTRLRDALSLEGGLVHCLWVQQAAHLHQTPEGPTAGRRSGPVCLGVRVLLTHTHTQS